jgi:hypothetical protein
MHGTKPDPLRREIDRVTVRLLTLERFEKRGLLRFGQKRELQRLRQWAIDTATIIGFTSPGAPPRVRTYSSFQTPANAGVCWT